MHWGASITAFGLGIFLRLPAWAGTVVTVQTIEGSLSLNRGAGDVEVLGWADAPSGSQVMANSGSRGKGHLCRRLRNQYQPWLGLHQDSSPCRAGVMGGGSVRTYVIGGLVIAGGTVAVIALTGGDDGSSAKEKKKRNADEPASP